MIVNKKGLADVCNVSERTLTDWQNDGMPVELVGGRGLENQYDTGKVIEWRIQRALAGTKVETAREQRDRLESQLLEMKIAEQAGLLVAADEVSRLTESAILAARTELTTLARRLKADIDARYQIDVDLDMLSAPMFQALTKLSENPPIVDPEQPETADDAELEEQEE